MNYTTIPESSVVTKTMSALKEHGIDSVFVNTKKEALDTLASLIPAKTKVMNGSSTTLKEIGFTDYLKKNPNNWVNLHEAILAEKDMTKQSDLRRHSLVDTDVFLASVNAVTQDGSLVACDATGSRVGAFHYAAKKLILVVGVQKIVPTIADAMKRIREYVLPLEDKRMHEVYGMGSATSKWVIIEKEFQQGRITVIFVNESLGF